MPYTFDFAIFAMDEYPPLDYLEWSRENLLSVRGEIVEYFWDFMKLIPCQYPHQKLQKRLGIDRYGPSVISGVGLEILQEIAFHSSKLIELCEDPVELCEDPVELSGDPTWVDDGGVIKPTSIKLEKITLSKEEVVQQLRELYSLVGEARSLGGRHFVACWGL